MVSAVPRNLNDCLIKKMPGAQGIDPHVVPTINFIHCPPSTQVKRQEARRKLRNSEIYRQDIGEDFFGVKPEAS